MRKLKTLLNALRGWVFLRSVTLTSKQHLEEVEASQECPQFAKNIFILKVQTQIGSHEDKHYVLPAVTGL